MAHRNSKEHNRKHRQKPHAKRDNFRRMLKYHYSMTLDEWDSLLRQQSGRCALCLAPEPKLVVDHDHTTENIRGLLCTRCNVGLGMLQDDITVLQRALEYLDLNGDNR